MSAGREAYYTYKVRWVPEEQEFVGTCEEFSHLSHFDPDQDAAFRGVRDLVRAAMLLLEEKQLPFPERARFK